MPNKLNCSNGQHEKLVAILINYKQFFQKRGIKSVWTRQKQKSLKKSTELHFSRLMIFLLYFKDSFDVNLWEKKFRRSTVYLCRTNGFIDCMIFEKIINAAETKQLKRFLNQWKPMYFRKLQRKKEEEISATRARHGNTGTYYMNYLLSFWIYPQGSCGRAYNNARTIQQKG